MTGSEKHQREMNIGSHIAWAAAMWSSGALAREQKNHLVASIGYYYCVYHIGFALINTDYSFHFDDMRQIKHNKVEKWLKNHLDSHDNGDYKMLRFVRENINYLGMESSERKLRVVRGHPFGYDLNNQKIPFDEMIFKCHESSRRIFLLLLNEIETFCKREFWQPLQFGRDYYISEYLGEDLLLGILPRENGGQEIFKNLVQLILTEESE